MKPGKEIVKKDAAAAFKGTQYGVSTFKEKKEKKEKEEEKKKAA